MAFYKCNKIVAAWKIVRINGNKMDMEGWDNYTVDPVMTLRYQPKPGDYLVRYEDGYQSFSPRKAFEEGYTRLTPE